MLLLGLESLDSAVAQSGFSGKMVFNERGAILFPVKRQHSEMKAEGISYEDNYKGNALAAMLAPGRIEIRFHKAFTDRAVARILGLLLAEPRLSSIARWKATYQGRPLPACSQD